MKKYYKPLVYFTFLFLLLNCARTGRPDGGPKDENPPLFVIAKPAYGTTNFKDKKVKIEFNEFVILKDLNKQLVVSPPMKSPPIITPQGSASDFIKIEILDTLQKNTTYIFNFGNAILDNNEGNKLENFKYVFSTGTYIDSLKTSGRIEDAKLKETPKNINVLLYKIDTAFRDSTIYKKKPNYITSTLDSTIFQFTNLKKGKYLMLALQESASDYIFNPKTDKIGFITDTISLPKDSIIVKPIILFKEAQPYKFRRAKEITRGKIQFGFLGDARDLEINILSDTPKDFKSVAKYETDKDTLNYWYKPFEADSLNFTITKGNFIDTVTVKLRKKQLDSLTLSASVRNVLHLRDTFFIKSNNPIIKIDTSKIGLVDKDTLAINFDVYQSKLENKVGIIFNKKTSQKYKLTAFPDALNDVFGIKNDTIVYRFTTKALDDYGRITLSVNNVKSKNLIIELLTGKNQDEIVERKFITTSGKIVFDLLPPQNYTIRAVIDENKNDKWDTGSYLERRLAERIIYHQEINNAELRANYFLEESLKIE